MWPRIFLGNGYHVRDTEYSSAKYGPCGVCRQRVSDVWLLSAPNGQTLFGHRGCLEQSLGFEDGVKRVFDVLHHARGELVS
jgi:hypothetical protein